jgi:thiol-disulfide isomerase/thioredoxin
MKKSFKKNSGNKKRRTYRRNKKANKKNTVVVGKIYSNWCGHCQNMADDWNALKNDLAKRGGAFEFSEIEQTHESTLLPAVNEKYLKKSPVKVQLQGGYPTVFKIKGGKLSYFEGNRTFEEMRNWFLQ